MKRLSMLWMLTLLLSGLATLTGCSSSDEESSDDESNIFEVMGLTRKKAQGNNKGIVIKLFERSGLKLQVVDVTDQFESATFFDKKVPVNHVYVEQLPSTIHKLVFNNTGMGSSTRICRMEYEGEYYYDIYSLFMSTAENIFNSNGERHVFYSTEEYEAFRSKATNICCILVLTTQIVKNAEGAPNYLVGYWQNDWQHLKHTQGEAFINLYPDLPFSITEVLRLNDDFTGYLRTVKTYKDGRNEVALDAFRYELTDYHGGEQYGYHGYSYKCFFEAGDVIEYMQRSYDGMQTLESYRTLAYYPWFKQANDQFESLEVNAGQKYGLPARDNNSPIVGRWTGGEYSEYLMRTVSTTWVFRSDNTGYRLLDNQYDIPFAYTVSYNGSEVEITIYKYNTGFTIDEGFIKDNSLTFDSTILPKGTTVKANINGNSLELDGWGNFSRQE